VQGVKMTDIFD